MKLILTLFKQNPLDGLFPKGGYLYLCFFKTLPPMKHESSTDISGPSRLASRNFASCSVVIIIIILIGNNKIGGLRDNGGRERIEPKIYFVISHLQGGKASIRDNY